MSSGERFIDLMILSLCRYYVAIIVCPAGAMVLALLRSLNCIATNGAIHFDLF